MRWSARENVFVACSRDSPGLERDDDGQLRHPKRQAQAGRSRSDASEVKGKGAGANEKGNDRIWDQTRVVKGSWV